MARAVVVGAGSAGCAVAGRLAERGVDVVLVDAGPDWRSESCPDEIRRPPDDVFAWRVDGRSPSRYAAPEVSARRFAGDRPEPYLRGWGMGGTSSINGLVVVRPPDDEWDHWVELGCDGWGPADVLPHFVRLEDDVDYGSAAYHGRGGPTPVVRRLESEWGDGDRLLADAAFAAGHAWEPDYHRPGALGVSRTASNIRYGVRVTSYDGYVDALRAQGRIDVRAGALVDRVIVTGGRAAGVRVVSDSGAEIIEADHVVLSAGAHASPAILQRSGIGPGPLIAQKGIRPVADLPVGEGVQDHVGFWLSVDLPGARPAANGARGNAMLRYSSDIDGSREGDLLVVAANPAPVGADEVAFGVKLGHCRSRGRSAIVSADPAAPADIDLNLLADAADRALARHAVRSAVALLGAGGRTVRDRFGGEMPTGASDDEVDAWLRRAARDTSHISGGCRMGPADAATTVVDTTLGVLGVAGLTVADMSVAPIVPRANTHLAAIMIGERAAGFVAGAVGAQPAGSATESRMPRSAAST
ncbi:GMC family oxidoreductase [Microbacterium thalassium]|uniref:Choline dehydrogenase n=1 Tax=Microbacterium thalassium TaxID=362649 RepID=A0A7X0KU22_9MICO|nr:GMC family oxidoreductase [Microbacterium thalassium]MBB6390648.1 choline dehydrogenase [Microbacterium thalassium]GLK25757.1 GMC family oxidoreductase [Microbacterium thalassium]